jgi:hypothetical protein
VRSPNGTFPIEVLGQEEAVMQARNLNAYGAIKDAGMVHGAKQE